MAQRATLSATLTVLFLGILVCGCAETARVRGGIKTTKKQLEQLERNGAYDCAPKDFALATAHIRFAELKLEQGSSLGARQHFNIARRHTELADEKSPADICAEAPPIFCVDKDKDTICQTVDLCPEQPEDFDGVIDDDGCPEDQDTDGDGIYDSIDQCVPDPEDMDAYLDDDGCPDLDNDFDKILDVQDSCINDPEDPDGFQDDDGCPDLDNDGDTLLDVDDECPNVWGEIADRGCPKKYEGVQITETQIRISQKIHFASNKAKIKKSSYWILGQVAQVLRDYPGITLRIEGHTDSKGSEKYNLKLSSKRAKAVMTHLAKRTKIAAHRLTSEGFGEAKPIDTNLTDEGRSANRRVEFIRTDIAPEPLEK
ncbi:MAG: OmpA family protein [Proteobacteria bacterium]|nr:OmpA family protein [Pseudomonadota bacterium]